MILRTSVGVQAREDLEWPPLGDSARGRLRRRLKGQQKVPAVQKRHVLPVPTRVQPTAAPGDSILVTIERQVKTYKVYLLIGGVGQCQGEKL